jgi:hypothetical protein
MRIHKRTAIQNLIMIMGPLLQFSLISRVEGHMVNWGEDIDTIQFNRRRQSSPLAGH